MLTVLRFPACLVEGGQWVVVDQTRDDATIPYFSDATCAELTGALMNGELAALAYASNETLARCHNAIRGVLRSFRPRSLPAVGSGSFPQIARPGPPVAAPIR